MIADIPGLIEGASEGAGLGIRFLKHLARTRLLLHLVDMAPLDGSDPADAAEVILHELEKFSPALTQRDRWLVLNKADQLLEEEREERVRQVVERLDWKGPVFVISALESEGTEERSVRRSCVTGRARRAYRRGRVCRGACRAGSADRGRGAGSAAGAR